MPVGLGGGGVPGVVEVETSSTRSSGEPDVVKVYRPAVEGAVRLMDRSEVVPSFWKVYLVPAKVAVMVLFLVG